MSQVVSPTTGRLITVGSDEFNELINSPTRGSHFTLPLTSVPVGTVKSMTRGNLPRSPMGVLPSVPIINTVPVMTSMSSLPQLPSANYFARSVNPVSPMSTLPAVPMSPRYNGIINHKVTNSPVSPMSTLPPVPMSPRYNSFTRSVSPMSTLPPVPMSTLPTVPMSTLPTVPMSPRYNNYKTPANSPVSPMSSLPPVPMSPRYNRVVNHKVTNGPTNSPVSPMSSLPAVPSPFDLPIYDIPSLEKVLSRTHQPHLREKLKKMIEEKREYEARGSPTRGWRARAPQRGQPRHQLMSECGRSCFLDPESEAYPICPKCSLGNNGCICAIDCGAVQAAYNRAKQYHKEDIAALAKKLLETKCLL